MVLRRFEPSDAALAHALGADPYVPLIGSLPARPSTQQARQWVRRQRQKHPDGDGFSFAIADAETDTAIGAIGLWLRDLPEGRATAGYAVSPEYRGRGAATSALVALTAFAWTIPALHRVESYIEPWNTASSKVATAAGYQREGLLRGHHWIGGTRRDMLIYAAIRP
ncbi:RimJ/RimL family protein N-acetyltransferase [Saccharomonospora amisosensis]|uniref:RimJ/RimL family protein N-acetyltransferase n=1 Tax=Saccharomonospora amisosensis TaxID=1128677 RepID=A0A7X5UPY9_9PSEU|nr:GNAT family N-acetyltransferase [Saccharomonospora amisosensis]NIJ12093.1 RimJ/RimL family protein N-acetyltransferase [Saccharomonospora amisosensis]